MRANVSDALWTTVYPELTLAQVYSALAYDEDHRDEIDHAMPNEARFVEQFLHGHPHLVREVRPAKSRVMLRGYADAHVVFALVQVLRQRGMDIVRVQDRGREHADDVDLLDEALADFLLAAAAPSDWPAGPKHHSRSEPA